MNKEAMNEPSSLVDYTQTPDYMSSNELVVK